MGAACGPLISALVLRERGRGIQIWTRLLFPGFLKFSFREVCYLDSPGCHHWGHSGQQAQLVPGSPCPGPAGGGLTLLA